MGNKVSKFTHLWMGFFSGQNGTFWLPPIQGHFFSTHNNSFYHQLFYIFNNSFYQLLFSFVSSHVRSRNYSHVFYPPRLPSRFVEEMLFKYIATPVHNNSHINYSTSWGHNNIYQNQLTRQLWGQCGALLSD